MVPQFVNRLGLGILHRADGNVQLLGNLLDRFSLDGFLDDGPAPFAQLLYAHPQAAIHLLAYGNGKVIIRPSLFVDAVMVGVRDVYIDDVLFRAVSGKTVFIDGPVQVVSEVVGVVEHDLFVPYLHKRLLHDILGLAAVVDIVLGITTQSGIETLEEYLPCSLVSLINPHYV